MQTPLRVTFRHMPSSAAVEARVSEHVGRLERFHHRIISCHVVVEAPAGHRRKGAPFGVRVELVVPGGDICVTNEQADREAHTDVYVALRDAFDTAKRRLRERVREVRFEPSQAHHG